MWNFSKDMMLVLGWYKKNKTNLKLGKHDILRNYLILTSTSMCWKIGIAQH